LVYDFTLRPINFVLLVTYRSFKRRYGARLREPFMVIIVKS